MIDTLKPPNFDFKMSVKFSREWQEERGAFLITASLHQDDKPLGLIACCFLDLGEVMSMTMHDELIINLLESWVKAMRKHEPD